MAVGEGAVKAAQKHRYERFPWSVHKMRGWKLGGGESGGGKHKLVQHVTENVVDQGLEDCRGTGETEGHDLVLKTFYFTAMLKAIFQLSPSHMHQIICIAQVKLGENGSLVERFKVGERERVFVFTVMPLRPL